MIEHWVQRASAVMNTHIMNRPSNKFRRRKCLEMYPRSISEVA